MPIFANLFKGSLSDGVMVTRLILVQKTPGSSPGRTTDRITSPACELLRERR